MQEKSTTKVAILFTIMDTRSKRMDELYLQWQDAYDAGETDEEFNDWFVGRYDLMECDNEEPRS